MLTRLSCFVGLALAAGACTTTVATDIDPEPDATLTVSNESDFTIVDLYLTSSADLGWGNDLLAGDVLYPDEAITLSVACDFYDARLIDSDGVECTVYGLDLCLNDATWVITNNTCAVFGAKAP